MDTSERVTPRPRSGRPVGIASLILVRPVGRSIDVLAHLAPPGVKVLDGDLPKAGASGRRLRLDLHGQVHHLADDVPEPLRLAAPERPPRTPVVPAIAPPHGLKSTSGTGSSDPHR